LLSRSPEVTCAVWTQNRHGGLDLLGFGIGRTTAYHLVVRELNERARLEQQLRERRSSPPWANWLRHRPRVNNPLAIMNAIWN